MNTAIAILAFGLLIFLKKKGSGKKWVTWVQGGLALIGGASLAETGLGVWLAARMSDLGGLVAGIFGGEVSGLLVVGVVTFIVTVIVCWDIGVDRVVDKPAMVGLIVLPLLFLAAAGPLADTGSGLTATVAEAASSSLGGLIGG